MMGSPGPNEHETVGAYALGLLDDVEATAFEGHLATCEWCAQQLDELAGMEPMLAALADLPGSGTPAIGESLSARPSPRVVNKLVDEVADRRARKRRKNFYMVAAAVALIVGGPIAATAATGGDADGGTGGATTLSATPAKDLFDSIEDKVSATDPSTGVSATVALEKKDWGAESVLKLGNVKGPITCSLIFIAESGERVTASNWSVPAWGYGLAGAKTEKARNPLYIVGGASFSPDDMKGFEVRSLDGDVLVKGDI